MPWDSESLEFSSDLSQVAIPRSVTKFSVHIAPEHPRYEKTRDAVKGWLNRTFHLAMKPSASTGATYVIIPAAANPAARQRKVPPARKRRLAAASAVEYFAKIMMNNQSGGRHGGS